MTEMFNSLFTFWKIDLVPSDFEIKYITNSCGVFVVTSNAYTTILIFSVS